MRDSMYDDDFEIDDDIIRLSTIDPTFKVGQRVMGTGMYTPEEIDGGLGTIVSIQPGSAWPYRVSWDGPEVREWIHDGSEIAALPTFRVGDHVRGTKRGREHYPQTLAEGNTGIVTSISEDSMVPIVVNWSSGVTGWVHRPEHLELIERGPLIYVLRDRHGFIGPEFASIDEASEWAEDFSVKHSDEDDFDHSSSYDVLQKVATIDIVTTQTVAVNRL